MVGIAIIVMGIFAEAYFFVEGKNGHIIRKHEVENKLTIGMPHDNGYTESILLSIAVALLFLILNEYHELKLIENVTP